MRAKETVLVISDTHFPFSHESTFLFLQKIKKKYRPTKVVHIGDLVDTHAVSDYTPDPDGLSANDEHSRALIDLDRIYNLFPRVIVTVGNHDGRVLKKAFKNGIPKVYLKSYHEVFKAPKEWSFVEKTEIDGIILEHGEPASGKNGAITMAQQNMNSTIIGHLHSHAGIQWGCNSKHLYFGMNVGCLINKAAYCFAYGSKLKNKPTIGVGMVIKGIPIWVPMVLSNSSGKWIGAL